MEKLKNKIYDGYETEIEKACKDDDLYDILMTEKRGEAFFELGAMFMFRVFAGQIQSVKYKQGATETKDAYIRRLEDDIVELQCSNRGWLETVKTL